MIAAVITIRPAAPNITPIMNERSTDSTRLIILFLLAFCRHAGILAASIISKMNDAIASINANANMCSFRVYVGC